MNFRMGLLVGGLGVAVIALIVAVVVLAAGDSRDPSASSAKGEPCPTTEGGGPSKIDLSRSEIDCIEAMAILSRYHERAEAQAVVSGWDCEAIPFAEYPVLVRCSAANGSRFDVLGTAPSAHLPPESAHPPGPTAAEEEQDIRSQFFYTPSGNIACALTPESVRCDISKRSWSPYVPKPSSCRLDWGPSVGVQAQGYGEFLCIGDSLFGGSYGELPYGNILERGQIQCISKPAGLLCSNQSGGGFLLSAQRVKLL